LFATRFKSFFVFAFLVVGNGEALVGIYFIRVCLPQQLECFNPFLRVSCNANALDYNDPRHEHDEPQEERYADLPFFDQFRIPAGRPDELFSDPPADTHKVVRHLAKENRYVIRVKGDSMAPRIQDGDLILVDYIKEPRPGNMVVATVNGGVVVKKYMRREGRVVLKSMNPQYADIEVGDTDQFVIAGVVLRIVEGAL